MLTWLHIGDLHLTEAHEQNYRDFQRLVAAIDDLHPGDIDFAILPGDNADDGTREQFQLVWEAIARLRLPLHILPGDHDFKPKNLDAFYQVLAVKPLPYATTVAGCRCLFLDVVSAGNGGPDFRLADDQLDWVEREIGAATDAGEDVLIFMHTYPADLKAGASRLNALLRAPCVRCVDMGHTHYNEIANDGHTVFMATRSTGQIEEGPVGFSLAALDDGGVSWRFKLLEDAWPCVLITHPVDRRLVIERSAVSGVLRIRAKVLSNLRIELVQFSTDEMKWHAMKPSADDPTVWEATLTQPVSVLVVRAKDAQGRLDQDVVELPDAGWKPPARAADGSDSDRIGAWPSKGLLANQLGPNRNGRKW